MFPQLRNEVENRFSEIEAFWKASRKIDPIHMATVKGLIFVQVYAAYEYTVNSAVQSAIDSIKSHRHKMADLSPSLLALFLDPELNSLRDIGRKQVWKKRLEIFNKAFSADVINLSSDTDIPHDGTHYRYSHLLTIFQVFGIGKLPVRRRLHIPRINEVVSHRNDIAHGLESADAVGRRYSNQEILKRIRQMKSVSIHMISVFDSFCADSSKHRRR